MQLVFHTDLQLIFEKLVNIRQFFALLLEPRGAGVLKFTIHALFVAKVFYTKLEKNKWKGSYREVKIVQLVTEDDGRRPMIAMVHLMIQMT